MPRSPPAPRLLSVNGPVSPHSAPALAEPSANVTSHLEAEEMGPSYVKSSRDAVIAGVKGIRGAREGVREGEAGTKWKHLPWAGRGVRRHARFWAHFGECCLAHKGHARLGGLGHLPSGLLLHGEN